MRRKQSTIGETLRIFFTPSEGDREALVYFETKLMMQNNRKDCIEIPDAEIIRHALHVAYTSEKRSGIVRSLKRGIRFHTSRIFDERIRDGETGTVNRETDSGAEGF